MNQTGWISLVGALALTLAACGGSGGGGGQMFVETCSLGCTNGSGGSQVSCGIVNTYQNQEVAVLFSAPVQVSSVSKQTFRIFDFSGGTPPGTYLLDPANPNRVIFRPKLSFNSLTGSPEFGFREDESYQILIPGTAQGDPAPYIRSTNGRPNQSRLLCTIKTDQGIIDPVPGAPTVQMFVDVVDPNSGVVTTGVPASGALNVATSSKLTFVFDDLMNVGTIVIPATQQAPFITIMVDGDGNLADPTDQSPVGGTYAYNIDQVGLVTTVVFTPSAGFPSAGPDPLAPRKIVVNVPPGVRDLVGNSTSNSGSIHFVPQAVAFPEVTLPPGGEQFLNAANEDPARSGADWGTSVPGRLKAGNGGGSGRMGDLVVTSGQTVTLATSPLKATGSIFFSANPANNATITINGVALTIRDAAPTLPTHVQRRQFLSYTLTELVRALNNSADPLIAEADYSQRTSNTLVVTYATAGADIGGPDGTPFSLAVGGTSNGTISGPILTGGLDAESYDGFGTVTNFDFQANPGGDPPPIVVSDGVFEFARVEVQNNATLRLVGDNAARVLSRGGFVVQSLGVVDVSGQDLPPHKSDNPTGQLGGRGGPFGALGGMGGDRFDQTGSDLSTLFGGANGNNSSGIFSRAVLNPGAVPMGAAGNGVGDVAGGDGFGVGGVEYPAAMSFPTTTSMLGALEVNSMAGCASEQVAGPGSGGAYATGGGDGVPMAANPTSTQGGSNTPAPTPGGTYQIEDTVPPFTKRLLTPKFGYLEGGSGGGGAGAHISQTVAGDIFLNCTTLAGATISTYRDHSGAGGGGGGGATQIVGGRAAQINGIIDASGGAGGSRDTTGPINSQIASPGGGGSGGAILLQSTSVEVAFNPNRLSIVGGNGGVGVTGSAGGKGGTGLIRAEGLNTLNLTTMAGSVNPFFNVPDQTDPSDPMAAVHWLSVGTWVRERVVPESFSGSQSCWMRPSGNFFQLDFLADVPGDLGWNMDLILQTGSGPQTVAYRGSTFFGGMSPQEFWGELLAVDLMPGEEGAPIVVRFQGAKGTGPLIDACNVDPTDPNGPIQIGSVTPWVRHPAELNAFTPRPDMIRFLILFDASHLDIATILGATNLAIHAQPN